MLDLAFSDVDRRFEQTDIGMMRTIETLLLDASNGKPVKISDDINIILNNNLDKDRMKAQLLLLKDAIKTSNWVS